MSATRSVVSRPSPVVEPEPSERGLRSRSLGTFFALAFGLGWGTMAAMAVFIDQIEATRSRSRPGMTCCRCWGSR